MSIEAKSSRRPSVALRIVVDILLAIDLICVMATALVEEAPHEYLGILFALLVIVHVVLNRRWFAALLRGKWTAERVLQVIAVAGIIVCAIGQVVSAVVLSKHALWFLPALPGASWARSMHMLCSYWAFVFAFAHVGLQFRGMIARLGAHRSALMRNGAATWALRAVWLLVAFAGAWSFVQLGMADYLFARVQFASADHGAHFVVRFAQYASIAVLVAGICHYLVAALRSAKRSRSGR